MKWYVKCDSLPELRHIPIGDTRTFTYKLLALLEQEKAFTLHGYEHVLTDKTLADFKRLIASGTFVEVVVGEEKRS